MIFMSIRERSQKYSQLAARGSLEGNANGKVTQHFTVPPGRTLYLLLRKVIITCSHCSFAKLLADVYVYIAPPQSYYHMITLLRRKVIIT